MTYTTTHSERQLATHSAASPARQPRRHGWWRAQLATGLLFAALGSVEAQTVPDVTGRPAPQPADSLFREGTRALTRGNYRRAASLFEMLRVAFPRSPYVPDSYYWHAFALQRLDEPRAQRDALVVLDEQQLRFPESAAGDDALALRARIESVAGREPASAFARPTECTDRDDLLAVQSLGSLAQLTDAESIRGYLASLLAMRTPCARELRRSAVYLVARRPDDDSRRMLNVVVEHDPDEVVRADARAALAKPIRTQLAKATELPPRRGASDTLPRIIGDTAAAGVVNLGVRKGSKVPVQLSHPSQLLVLAVVPGQPIEILSPSEVSEARRVAAGSTAFDVRSLDEPTRIVATGFSSIDKQAFDFRIEAQLDACMARQTAKAQAALNRTWNAKASQSGKPVLQQPLGAVYDYAAPGGVSLYAARVGCEQEAGRIAPPPPINTVIREAITEPARSTDRYLIVLAANRPVSLPWLIVRAGTVSTSGVTMMEIADRITATLFAGHPGAWSGAVIPW